MFNINGEAGLEYRATKDLDIVLSVEALSDDFIIRLWEFIRLGGYATIKKSTGEKCFYRFTDPSDKEYPYMLEILSNKSEILEEREVGTIIPMMIEDEIVSLSAILLNKEYYQFIMELRFEIDDIIIADERCIIPLKARAFLDLSHRKKNGEYVRGTDIKKHKNDIYRMTQLLTEAPIGKVPKLIQEDIQKFVKQIDDDDSLLKQLKIEDLTISTIIERLLKVYCQD